MRDQSGVESRQSGLRAFIFTTQTPREAGVVVRVEMERGVFQRSHLLSRRCLEARGRDEEVETPHAPPSPLLLGDQTELGNHRPAGRVTGVRKTCPGQERPGRVGERGCQPCGPQPTHCLAVSGVGWGPINSRPLTGVGNRTQSKTVW